MLNFCAAEKSSINVIINKTNCGDAHAYRSIICDLCNMYESVEYTVVDGAVMFKFSSAHKNPVFSMPLGQGWEVMIPLLVVYTQEHYIHTIFEGVRSCDVNKLLSMYPGSRINVDKNSEIGGEATFSVYIK